jgi:hypothetical protein
MQHGEFKADQAWGNPWAEDFRTFKTNLMNMEVTVYGQ